jgi:WD40 repeat protein
MPGSVGTVHLIDISGTHRLDRVEITDTGSAVMSHDRQVLVATTSDGFVRLLDTATGKSLAFLQHEGHASNVTLNPDDRLLATSDEKDIRIFEAQSGKLISRIPQDGHAWYFEFSPDGRFLAMRDKDRALQWVDTATGRVIASNQQNSPVQEFTFSPNGSLLAIGSQDEETVRLLDSASGAEQFRIHLSRQPYWMAFSPDGQTLAIQEYGFRLIDVPTGAEQARLQPQGGDEILVGTPVFSPDGRTLAVVLAAFDGTSVKAWLFNTKSWQQLAHIVSVASQSQRLVTVDPRVDRKDPLSDWAGSFSPDGRFFAVGAAGSHPARLFEANSGKELAQIELGIGSKGVAFSPDGRYLAAAGGSGAVRLLETDSRKELAYIQHASAVTDLRFSTDNRFLATASRDGTVRLT